MSVRSHRWWRAKLLRGLVVLLGVLAAVELSAARPKPMFSELLKEAEAAADEGAYVIARKAFAAALKQRPPTSAEAFRVERLRQVLDEAAKPRPFTLRSDGKTVVAIEGPVRRTLGKFREMTIEIPAGKYTARGWRFDYEKVTVDFEVGPQHPQAVTVTCDVPL